ncbi:hypothetical protein [Marilutibacter chinensis]|uniref:Beta-barrel assembly machine subunit BamC n=1 Tax=Marilutibacter chinensis TaxID=2912247 RepID=A0ABS9HRE8_9GAMM|nr:hypothetical protein [Lysobacter chinensis]MCF7220920.1 hypothetical protein [Lysobacter chinensis]
MISRFPMISRAALAAALATALVATAGCSWFRKGDDLYAADPADRPLEVPPPLPSADDTQAGGSVTASSVIEARRAGAASALGFNAQGSRDEVFARIGEALERIEGVTIVSRAQLLGAYDVNYQGSNFLVRVSDTEGGAYVSAVDPRGVPASGDAPAQLVRSLQEALGGQ